jgi:hypothetical protein
MVLGVSRRVRRKEQRGENRERQRGERREKQKERREGRREKRGKLFLFFSPVYKFLRIYF